VQPPAVASGQGEPLLVLDWAPSGTGGPYAGSYAGVDHVIAGQVIKVQDKDSSAVSDGYRQSRGGWPATTADRRVW
jgi:hypothetical protein